MLEILAGGRLATKTIPEIAEKTIETDARTLENSEVGDMTKLSLVLDHDIKCWMLESSSMLFKGQVMSVPRGKFRTRDQKLVDVLVKLVDECGLYHFGLLGCSSSPNGRVLGITGNPDFGAIGVDCAGPVAIGTAVNRHSTRGDRGWRSDLHGCRGVLSGLRENGEVSRVAGTICRSGEGGPGGRGIGETTHVGRKGETRGRQKRAAMGGEGDGEPTIVAGIYGVP